MTKTYRIGQIVPSSNTTMETEVPAMLLAHQIARPEDRFTFHSSRMRMKHVVKEELAAMDAESDRCALELSDVERGQLNAVLNKAFARQTFDPMHSAWESLNDVLKRGR